MKGNYILIPFRNLVLLFDCQVLPLIVCNAFLCVYLECVYVVFREHTVSHKYTHSQTGLSKAVTRPEHYIRWCYYYASGLF